MSKFATRWLLRVTWAHLWEKIFFQMDWVFTFWHLHSLMNISQWNGAHVNRKCLRVFISISNEEIACSQQEWFSEDIMVTIFSICFRLLQQSDLWWPQPFYITMVKKLTNGTLITDDSCRWALNLWLPPSRADNQSGELALSARPHNCLFISSARALREHILPLQ